MSSQLLQETSLLLRKDLEINSIPPDVTEKEIIDFLERLVESLLDGQMERLFYFMYRLDIDELKIRKALHPESIDPPHKAIARLMFDREIQKAQSRLDYRQKHPQDEGDGWA